MADEIMGLTGSFSVDTSQLTVAATQVQSASAKMVTSLQNVNAAAAGSVAPMKNLNAEAARLDATAKNAATGMGSFGGKLLIVGQFADDVQYGLRAVVNQIPQLTMAFGMGAGLAGALSIVAVVANQVVQRWGQLTAAFQTTFKFPGVETAKERLEDVNKEIDKLKELDRLDATQLEKANSLISERVGLEKQVTAEKERQQKLEAFMNRRTPEEAARGAQFTGAVGSNEAGLIADIKAAMDKEAEMAQARYAATVQARIARMDASNATPQEKLDFANKELGEVAARGRQSGGADRTKLAENLVIRLGEGDAGARKQLDELMNAGTGVVIGGEGFRDRLNPGNAARGRAISEDLEAMAQLDMVNEFLAQSDALKGQDAGANAADAEHEAAMKAAEDRGDEEQARQKINEELNRKFFDERDKATGGAVGDERESDLNWKLRGLLNRSAMASNSFGDVDSYEASIKATSGEAQLKKLHDINEVLKDIKRNTEKRGKVAERIAR